MQYYQSGPSALPMAASSSQRMIPSSVSHPTGLQTFVSTAPNQHSFGFPQGLQKSALLPTTGHYMAGESWNRHQPGLTSYQPSPPHPYSTSVTAAGPMPTTTYVQSSPSGGLLQDSAMLGSPTLQTRSHISRLMDSTHGPTYPTAVPSQVPMGTYFAHEQPQHMPTTSITSVQPSAHVKEQVDFVQAGLSYVHQNLPMARQAPGPMMSQSTSLAHPSGQAFRSATASGENYAPSRPTGLPAPHNTMIQGRLRPISAPGESGQPSAGVDYIIAPSSAREQALPMASRALATPPAMVEATVRQVPTPAPAMMNTSPTASLPYGSGHEIGAAMPAMPVQSWSNTPQHPEVEDKSVLPIRDVQPRMTDAGDTGAPLEQAVHPHYAEEPPLSVKPQPVLTPESCTPITVGRELPPAHIDLHGVCVNLQDFFGDRCGVIFGLVGAFCPVDTDKAVPQILKCMESFERLVDFVGCLVVNDPFVVKAWAKKLEVTDQFTFIADSDAKFTKVLGMCQYLPSEGLGVRSRRFAIVVGPRAKVRWVGFDEDSFAESVLTTLPRFVRTPWKSFLASIGYTDGEEIAVGDSDALNEEQRVKEDTVNTIQSMRSLLKAQGFCAEQDWQLILCDKMSQVFTPTRSNILNGLRWLVEGAQAGDVLCFYFAGKGGRYVNNDGVECVGLLPMDYEKVGPIGEWEIYDLLAPHVPESCRLTIILDINNEHAVTCPLPFVYNSEVSMASAGFMEAQISKGTNKQWYEQFNTEDKLAGELIVITLVGHAEVPHGCLASLLNTVCAPIPSEDKRPGDAENSPGMDPPLSYADQMDRMQIQLVEWGAEKSVQILTSRPLSLMEEFSLSDVLP